MLYLFTDSNGTVLAIKTSDEITSAVEKKKIRISLEQKHGKPIIVREREV